MIHGDDDIGSDATVARILVLAAMVMAGSFGLPARKLAYAINELFGVGFPCGFAEPTVDRNPGGQPVIDLDGTTYSPEEARGVGIALLRAADDAERR